MPDRKAAPKQHIKPEPDNDKLAYKLALLGLTNKEIAVVFDVHEDTIVNWIKNRPDFSIAVKRGREIADAKVAAALFRRATGMKVPAVKIFNDMGLPLIVPYVEHLPPDVGAIKLWLRNRQTARWHEAMTLKRAIEAEMHDEDQPDTLTIFELPDNGRSKEEKPEDSED